MEVEEGMRRGVARSPLVTLATAGLLLLCVAAALPGARADEDGWEQVESVPAWVWDPPSRARWLRGVDVHAAEALEEAYDPDLVLHELLAIRWHVEGSLRPHLGEAAVPIALRSAKAAHVTRKAFSRDPDAPDGLVYAVFLLRETPLAPILAAVPAAQRERATAALMREAERPVWKPVSEEPPWLHVLPPNRDTFYVAVTKEQGRVDVARALAEAMAGDHATYEIRNRLRFVVGRGLAFEIADRARTDGTIAVARSRMNPPAAWLLWSVPVLRILEGLPESSRGAARRALGEPIPPDESEWCWVEEEPDWVKQPPRWPRCLPYVQVGTDEDPYDAQEAAEEDAERAVREHLGRLLHPVVGASAGAAAQVGARSRLPCARAVREQEVETDAPGGETRVLVTTWILWELQVDRILESLDPKQRAAAEQALLR